MSATSGADFRGILYIFDSLRRDHVGCYGYPRDTTPNIDRVARDGIRFTDAYSQAIWTYPSAGSIFTGLYPRAHGSHQFEQPLDTALPHLADGFEPTDVKTACFSTTLGVSPRRGYERGFDEFYHIGENDRGLRPDVMDLLNKELLPWIRSHSDSSFFVVVWAMGTHHPYLTPRNCDTPAEPVTDGRPGTSKWLFRQPAEDVDSIKQLYDLAIEYSDEKFGDLLDLLEEEDIYDETSIFITSDHGEIFDEHARLEHVRESVKRVCKSVLGRRRCRYYGLFDRSAFIGHQDIVPYQELIRVPLIVKAGAGNRASPGTVEETTELVDLLPTIYEWAHLDPPTVVQGRSMFDRSGIEPEPRLVFTYSQVHNKGLFYASVHDDTYKLCHSGIETIHASDLLEVTYHKSILASLLRNNEILLSLRNGEMIVTEGDVTAAMRRELNEHATECERIRTALVDQKSIKVDDETKASLEALGYR